MAHQANGFIAYILACIILGPQDAAHGPFKTLRQMKAASAFGRFNGAHAAAYQEAYYCFVLPMIYFYMELFDPRELARCDLILDSPFQNYAYDVKEKNKKFGIWSAQYVE